MSRARLLSVACSLALVPLLAGTSVGAADTTVGAAFTPASPCAESTFVQRSSPSSGYTVPTDGVITRWRYVAAATAPTQVAFKLARSSAATSGFDIVGTSPTVAAVGGTLLEQPVRIPARAGDFLGLYVGGLEECGTSPVAAHGWVAGPGNQGVGPLVTNTQGPDLRLDVAATLEPDADRDGWGDVSQDLCPTDPTIQTVCGTGAPETTISSLSAKKAKKASKKAAVTVTFAASETSTFECAVDSPVFVRCASPYVVKAKVGKHTLAVRATDTAGNVDRTAAVRSFTVKKAKR